MNQVIRLIEIIGCVVIIVMGISFIMIVSMQLYQIVQNDKKNREELKAMMKKSEMDVNRHL